MREPAETSVTGSPMELVYIDLPLPTPAESPRHVSPARTKRTVSSGHPIPLTDAESPTRPAASEATGAPLQVKMSSDDWSMPSASSEHEDGIRFDPKSPMASINPIQPAPPERFRMRRQVSLADVLRAVGQALFWPPGYSDDPCAGLAEAAQALSGSASTVGRRALLEDVVRQQHQYCP